MLGTVLGLYTLFLFFTNGQVFGEELNYHSHTVFQLLPYYLISSQCIAKRVYKRRLNNYLFKFLRIKILLLYSYSLNEKLQILIAYVSDSFL